MRALWFKHINTTLQKPMYFPPLFPFFSRFCCKIPNQILWLPAGFYASHKWCDCQTDKHAISQSGEGKKKIQPLSHPASYHKGTFNKPHEKEQVILCNDFIKCPHHTWR